MSAATDNERSEAGGWSAASCSAREGDLFQFLDGEKLVTKTVETNGKHGLWYNGGTVTGVSYIRVGWDRVVRWWRCSHPGCGYPDGKPCHGCGLIVARQNDQSEARDQ